MKRLTDISDTELDAIREGRAVEHDPEAVCLTPLVRALDAAFPEPSTARLESSHVAAMLEAASLVTDKGESAHAPASNAHGPAVRAAGLPKSWRERVAMKMNKVWATTGAKIAIVAGVMVLAFTGVAVAGVLPTPVQNAVADTVKAVGIDLPGGTDHLDATDPDDHEIEAPGAIVDTEDANDASHDSTEQIEAGDQGDHDDQGEDASDDSGDSGDEHVTSGQHSDQIDAHEADDADKADSSDESDHEGHAAPQSAPTSGHDSGDSEHDTESD